MWMVQNGDKIGLVHQLCSGAMKNLPVIAPTAFYSVLFD